MGTTFVRSLHSIGHGVKFWQASLKDTGLTTQCGQLLGASHQSCPLRRGTGAASVGHVLRTGLLLTGAVADMFFQAVEGYKTEGLLP